jgi:hypothetical protein
MSVTISDGDAKGVADRITRNLTIIKWMGGLTIVFELVALVLLYELFRL